MPREKSPAGRRKTSPRRESETQCDGPRNRKSPKNNIAEFLPEACNAPGETRLSVMFAFAQTQDNQPHISMATLELAAEQQIKHPAKLLRDPQKLAESLRGLAHAERLLIMAELMAGPQTHQALHNATGLKPGPLYHHIRELQRAGLVESPNRNQYKPTREGELIFLLTAGLKPCIDAQSSPKPWRTRKIRLTQARRPKIIPNKPAKKTTRKRRATTRTKTQFQPRKKKADHTAN